METHVNKLDEDLVSFLAESREILEDIEPRLVGLGERLENNQEPDDETVNHIFRGFHTIKGTAAFYQLDQVVSVAHKAETLLEFFRSGKGDITVSSTDILCQVCDILEMLFKSIESGECSEATDDRIRSIIFRLNGRIDLFRKKLDELTEGVDAEEIYDDTYSEKYERHDGDDRVRRSDRNIRIFAAESRVLISKILELYFMRSDKTVHDIFHDDINQAIEWIAIISESASFLGVDECLALVAGSLDLLKHLGSDDPLPKEETLNDFKEKCESLYAFFERMETNGPEFFSHDEIKEERAINGSFPSETLTGHGENMATFFYTEAYGLLDDMNERLSGLAKEPYKRKLQGDMLGYFHKFKENAGMMNLPDLEFIALKAEEIMEYVLDDLAFLDSWDLKAVRHVVSAMKNCLIELEKGAGGTMIDKPALVYILDQIKSGKETREKENEIILPKQPGFTDESDSRHEKDIDEGLLMNLQCDSDTDYQPVAEEKNVSGSKKDIHTITHDVAARISVERKDIRVNTEKLDELINLVGELVIAENMVINNPDIQGLGLENFEKASSHLRKIIRDLQDVALAVRMVPISGVFRRMIRLVHDLSMKSDKKVSLRLIGEDTEIDKAVGELISDPLVHLIRNAIDHGIEKKTDKRKNGEDGQIIVEASHEGGEVVIIVRDNGKGLDTERIYQKAVEMGIVSYGGGPMTVEEIHELIFQPGFSTCRSVTDFSGRGVGLDVVKNNLEKIKGRINVFSLKGRGTAFVMRIPLTLAIIDGMLVRVGKSSFTIPLLSIRESIQISRSQVTITMDGQEMMNLRGQLIPVIRLHKLYHVESDFTDLAHGLIVVIEHRNETAGLFIDEIIGEQQTVIKGLSTYIDHVSGISGCTILGDGEVSLILDVGGLIKKAQYEDNNMTISI